MQGEKKPPQSAVVVELCGSAQLLQRGIYSHFAFLMAVSKAGTSSRRYTTV